MTADPLYEAMKAALLACPAGCTCRGTYTGPERRSVHRDPDLIPDVEADAAAGRAFYSWDRP